MPKNKSFFLILALVVGAAIGWFLQGFTADARMSNNKSPSDTPAPAKTDRSGNMIPEDTEGKITNRIVSPKETDEVIALATKNWQSPRINKMQGMIQQRIDKLAGALELTDVQKANLHSWLDKLGEDADAMRSVTNKQLEEQLLATLTGKQKIALDTLKSRETRSRIQAEALKSLSQMQGVIDFEEDQQDAVYKILNDAAVAKITEENKKSDLLQILDNRMGYDSDPYNLGIEDAFTEAYSGEETDRKQAEENLRDIMNQRIEAKVNQLRPVLNDKQLAQYRTELKNKGAGSLEMAIQYRNQGVQAVSAGTHVFSIQLPKEQ